MKTNQRILILLLAVIFTFCQESGTNTISIDQQVKDTLELKSQKTEIPTPSQNNRAIWQKPELVLKKLGDISKKTVADIGAGTGYFSFRILPTAKRVIAIDIDAEAIKYIDSVSLLLPEPYKSHFESRLAEPNDPHLKVAEIDIALLVNTYLYIENPVDYFRRLKSKLSEHGELLIIDYKKKKIPLGPDANERIALAQVEDEIERAGYTIIESDDQSLSYQYILRAKK